MTSKFAMEEFKKLKPRNVIYTSGTIFEIKIFMEIFGIELV